MRCLARVALLVAIIALVPVLAMAQGTAPAGSAASSEVPPADGDTSPPGPSASAKPLVPATGYSYGAPTAPRVERPRVHAGRGNPAGTDATMAGFETLADGSTRLFVELSKPVAYDTKAARSTLTYVLKGARVDRRNNENPLVTVHFNTPVTSARLVPHGHDLWLVVGLRASVQPTTTMDATKDGATFHIDFARGDYLPAPSEPQSTAPPPSASSAAAPPPPAQAISGKAAP